MIKCAPPFTFRFPVSRFLHSAIRVPKSEILPSVPDHANRRLVDESARSCLTPRLIDLITIDDTNGRVGLGPDSTNLEPLWDERASNENQPLRNFLVLFRRLASGSIGERGGDAQKE